MSQSMSGISHGTMFIAPDAECLNIQDYIYSNKHDNNLPPSDNQSYIYHTHSPSLVGSLSAKQTYIS